MQARFGSNEGLHAFVQQVRRRLGRETALLDERVLPWLGAAIYNRTTRSSQAMDPVWIQWTVTGGGQVQSLLVQRAPSPAPSRFLDYRPKTRLRLPFDGTWFVFWGGRSVLENYHAVARAQRFAYDFLIVHDGSTRAGNPTRNESYFCFGSPVLVPGDGSVAAAIDDVADNLPGQMNERQPLGNHVVVDHAAMADIPSSPTCSEAACGWSR